MVPNQKDVLADYLSDMFGLPSAKQEKEEEGTSKDEQSNDLTVSEESESSVEVQSNLNAEQQAAEEQAIQKLVDALDDLRGKNDLDDSVADDPSKTNSGEGLVQSSSSMTAASEQETSLAVAVKERSLELPPEISNSVQELTFQIDADKQLACLIDLVNQPIDKLSEGERSIVLMDLLELLKGIPESRLKGLLRDRFEQVREVSEASTA